MMNVAGLVFLSRLLAWSPGAREVCPVSLKLRSG